MKRMKIDGTKWKSGLFNDGDGDKKKYEEERDWTEGR